jgi:hypothetical protein
LYKLLRGQVPKGAVMPTLIVIDLPQSDDQLAHPRSGILL